MRIKRITLYKAFVLSLVLLASMNAFAKFFYFMYLTFIVMLCFQNGKFRIDTNALVLIAFSMCYYIFDSNVWESSASMLRNIAYPLAYIIGLNYRNIQGYEIDCYDSECVKDYKQFLLVIAMGALIHYLMNFVMNLSSVDRNTMDIWSGTVMNATLQAALAGMGLGILVAVLVSAKRIWKRVASGFGILSVLAYNLILAGRTLILIVFLQLLIASLFQVRSRAYRNKNSYIIICIIAIMMCLFLLVPNIEEIFHTNLFTRINSIGFFTDNRILLKEEYIKKLLVYPFGDNRIYGELGFYAHDLFLDCYSEAGIFAFICLCILVTSAFGKLVNILRNQEIDFDLRQQLLCVNISLIVYFFIEPVIVGMPWMFMSYCMIQGMSESIYQSARKNTLRSIQS